MAVSPSFVDAAKTLCRAVAPDLRRRGCYVVPFSTVADRYPALAGGDCHGWTSAVLDLDLQPLLKSRGQWRGRGFCTIIRDDWLPADHFALAITLHELAHWAADCSPLARKPASRLPAWVATALHCRQENQFQPSTTAPRIERPAWDGHGAKFIRLAVHLQQRAKAAGFSTTLESMGVAGKCYGLSRAVAYQNALGDEPRTMAGAPLRTVAETPEPQPFTQLFARDTAA